MNSGLSELKEKLLDCLKNMENYDSIFRKHYPLSVNNEYISKVNDRISQVKTLINACDLPPQEARIVFEKVIADAEKEYNMPIDKILESFNNQLN